MKKILLKSILFSMLSLIFISCSDDNNNEPWVEPEYTTTGVYVLNSGSYNPSIDAALTYYDNDTNITTGDVFLNKNEISLGNGGQDMVIYGSKMYITVTQSNCIYVTDKTGKLLKYDDGTDAIIKPSNDNSQPRKPRSAMAYNGKVYVSLYDGNLARIDTATMKIDKLASLDGTYPEEFAIVNNKAYVTISDYMGTGIGTKVSVIDLNSFTKTGEIEVTVNPTKIVNDKDGNLYVISNGNYSTIPSCLQKITTSDNKVTVLGTDVASNMEAGKDKIYLMKEDYVTSSTNLSYYDIATNKIVDEAFVNTESADIKRAYNITVDPITENIYIATSDYKNEGGMYIYKSTGEYIKSFKTKGINPMGAYFITSEK
jgi:hypothetical protein